MITSYGFGMDCLRYQRSETSTDIHPITDINFRFNDQLHATDDNDPDYIHYDYETNRDLETK